MNTDAKSNIYRLHKILDRLLNVEISFPKFLSQYKGHIYKLRNAAHDLDIFKIGLTTKTAENRTKQLSGTASPVQFLIINRWAVKNCVLAEKLIHEKLDRYRLNPKREFFKLKIELAMNEILPITSTKILTYTKFLTPFECVCPHFNNARTVKVLQTHQQ